MERRPFSPTLWTVANCGPWLVELDLQVGEEILVGPVDPVGKRKTEGDDTKDQQAKRFEKVVAEIPGEDHTPLQRPVYHTRLAAGYKTRLPGKTRCHHDRAVPRRQPPSAASSRPSDSAAAATTAASSRASALPSAEAAAARRVAMSCTRRSVAGPGLPLPRSHRRHVCTVTSSSAAMSACE